VTPFGYPVLNLGKRKFATQSSIYYSRKWMMGSGQQFFYTGTAFISSNFNCYHHATADCPLPAAGLFMLDLCRNFLLILQRSLCSDIVQLYEKKSE
jgi:hypothetical protein